jgi:hypothetical protein
MPWTEQLLGTKQNCVWRFPLDLLHDVLPKFSCLTCFWIGFLLILSLNQMRD